MAVEFGVILDFRNPSGDDWVGAYERFLARARRAEAAGFDVVALTEHHFVPDGYAPSLLPLAAALARETTRIRITTWVLLLPLHHPVHVAEAAATVDILSGGRFELGVGLGYRPEEFAGFGVPRHRRGRIMDAHLQVLLDLLAGRTVDHDTPELQVHGARLSPPPVQRPFPVWVGARSAPAARRAARAGCPLLAVPGEAGTLDAYRQAWAERGGDPAAATVGINVNAYVTDDPDGTWHQLRDVLRRSRDEYAAWYAAGGDLADDPLARAPGDDDELRHTTLLGPPDQVAEAIAPRLEDPAVRRVLVMPAPAGTDPDLADEWMQAFAHQVIPRLR